MDSASPLVSVVIPSYNAARFVSDAIASVLSQTYAPVECIVVDDGSQDDTASVVKAFSEITVVSQSNQGVARARNEGARAARGRFVAFLDSDDAWTHDKLERQMACFADPEIAAVYCGITITDADLESIADLPAPPVHVALENTLLMRSPVMSLAQTGVFRIEAFNELDGFDERMSTSADADLACRAALSMKMAPVRECLVLYRTHDKQMHSNLDAVEADMLLLLDKLSVTNPDIAHRYARRARAALFAMLAAARWKSRRSTALRYAMRAIGHHPAEVIRLALARR